MQLYWVNATLLTWVHKILLYSVSVYMLKHFTFKDKEIIFNALKFSLKSEYHTTYAMQNQLLEAHFNPAWNYCWIFCNPGLKIAWCSNRGLTHNPQIPSHVPWPLGHGDPYYSTCHMLEECWSLVWGLIPHLCPYQFISWWAKQGPRWQSKG